MVQGVETCTVHIAKPEPALRNMRRSASRIPVFWWSSINAVQRNRTSYMFENSCNGKTHTTCMITRYNKHSDIEICVHTLGQNNRIQYIQPVHRGWLDSTLTDTTAQPTPTLHDRTLHHTLYSLGNLPDSADPWVACLISVLSS